MDTTQKILKLLQEKNISAHKLEIECGLANASIQSWRNGRSKPSTTSLKKIATYFNVSLDFLLNDEINNDIYKVPNIYPTDGIISFEEIGTIRAGYDSTINEIPTGNFVDIPISALNNKHPENFFVLTIKGNSMYPKLIEGDKILCLRCDSVDSGDLAVILYNGDEATVKKVNYVYGEDWLELVPINPEYQTKRIEGADLQLCRVLGKVVKLIRDF